MKFQNSSVLLTLILFDNAAKIELSQSYHKYRGGSRTAATSKMERFVIIVNGLSQSAPSWMLWQP